VTATKPVVRNADQYRVLVAYGRGLDLNAVAAEVGAQQDYVAGVVSSLAGFDRGRARSLAADYDRQRSAVAATKPPAEPAADPPPPVGHIEPQAPQPRAVEELLARAESR
jgi:hypothetical protein